MKITPSKFTIAVVLSPLLMSVSCWALEPQTLFNFQLSPGTVTAALIQGPDGNFYGTTAHGGPTGNGTVFRVTPAGELTTLVSDQANPAAGLVVGNDGLLYGMTGAGGAFGFGTVFKVTTNGALTNIAVLDGANGGNPQSGLVLAGDGNFYGASQEGGPNGAGAVFRVTPGGVLTTLVSFDGFSLGGFPTAGLTVGADGNLYGITASGGAAGRGTIFKMKTNGTLITLHSFQATDGFGGQARLTPGSDGNLYGASREGGTAGRGAIFRITINGVFTNLVSFDGTNGSVPLAELTLGADGQLYGTTETGGSANAGTVFKVTTGGALTTLAFFNNSVDGLPQAGLLLASDGNFYGCSQGAVFKMTPGGVLTTLVSLIPVSGTHPEGGLAVGPDGNFYGTTRDGGSNNVGTIFRLTPNGVLTSLFSFNSTNGASPQGGLLLGTDGNFYGTTSLGGPQRSGTVFRFATNGVLTTLASFNGTNGANPHCQLVMDANGNFYGTAPEQGANFAGTVFRVKTNGVLTMLVPFNNTNGAFPEDGLTAGNDGNFYGTTANGGGKGEGTIFKVTPGGALTTIFSFSDTNGAFPFGGLVQGNDGNFYGTTGFGGTNFSFGTIFKVTPGGVLTTLHNFNFADGEEPSSKLIFGPDGNLYGTTSLGGSTANNPVGTGSGTVFQITTNGAFTSLVVFQGTNGSNPQTPLVLGKDGNLYGTTANGGSRGGGTIFRLVLNPNTYDGVDLTDPAQTEADSDGDGVTNLVEYALGTDPRDPGDGNAGMATELITVSGSRFLALQYKRRVDATALQLQYLPEVSGDRTNWFSDGVIEVSSTPLDSDFNSVTVRDLTPLTAVAPRFIRLRVVSSSSQSTSPFWVGTDTALLGNGGSGSRLTLFSQRMVRPVAYAGKITGLQDAILTDTNAAWTTGQFGTNGTLAYVEFDNGFMVDIANTFAATHSLVLADNLSGISSIGNAYRIRPHSTIASIFGTNNETGLKSGQSAAQADTIILQVAQSQLTMTIFYFSNQLFHGWVKGDLTLADQQVIHPEEGVMVLRVAPGDLNLLASGPVKMGVTVAPVEPGFNLVGTLKSLSNLTIGGLNLFTGNLATGFASGVTASGSDNLLVVEPDGTTTTYFYFNLPGVFEGWVDASLNLAANVPIPAGSAFFIRRQAPGPFDWTIPAE